MLRTKQDTEDDLNTMERAIRRDWVHKFQKARHEKIYDEALGRVVADLGSPTIAPSTLLNRAELIKWLRGHIRSDPADCTGLPLPSTVVFP